MSDEQTQYMTQEKFEALKRELAELKEGKISVLAKRIDDARQMGDLSENAEYHTAREEMTWAQSRVKELEYILNNMEIIHVGGGGRVGVGSTVTVSVSGKAREYRIVGAQEADPVHGNISNESPLGQAFLGKRKGDTVQVHAPAGIQVYEITDIA